MLKIELSSGQDRITLDLYAVTANMFLSLRGTAFFRSEATCTTLDCVLRSPEWYIFVRFGDCFAKKAFAMDRVPDHHLPFSVPFFSTYAL